MPNKPAYTASFSRAEIAMRVTAQLKERPLLITELCLVLFLVVLAEKVLNFKAVFRLVLFLSQLRVSPAEIDLEYALALCTAIVQGFRFRRTFCMKRSLLLFYLTRSRGIPTHIHVGINVVGSNLSAHAWVSKDDCHTVLDKSADDSHLDYSEVVVFPES